MDLRRVAPREPTTLPQALHALTGADPVPPACRGNIRAMADA
jgi:hypothetical protein